MRVLDGEHLWLERGMAPLVVAEETGEGAAEAPRAARR